VTCYTPQSIQSRYFTRKVFRNNGLLPIFTDVGETIFRPYSAELLIARHLYDAYRQNASQSIVKEWVTRKVFWNKELPNGWLTGPPSLFEHSAVQMRTLRLCAFGGQGQG
jgi:hypothetical protein